MYPPSPSSDFEYEYGYGHGYMSESESEFESESESESEYMSESEYDSEYEYDYKSKSKSEFRNWLELPQDQIKAILHRLGAIEILTSAQYVCSAWHRLCKDRSMWRCIDMYNLGDLHDMPYDLEKMCRHAVDRSCGELVDINVEYFGTDDLVKYITDSSSQIRRLRLAFCNSISPEGLIEVAAKLPLLEELDLTQDLTQYIASKKSLEVVGRSCPLLKSLKINRQGYRRPRILCDKKAFAIAENMPGLRHLDLFGHKLTNNGLQAILDGCPLLESLDLRQCFNVTLEGDLGRRCTERIKDLRRPSDPTNDCEFDTSIQDGYGDDDEVIFDEEEDYFL